MTNIFNRNQYHHIIDFIDAAIDSENITTWLTQLEKTPESLRWQYLAKLKNQMDNNKEKEKIISIVELLNNNEILKAMNAVIKEVRESGMGTSKFLKKKDNNNFNLLISLITAP